MNSPFSLIYKTGPVPATSPHSSCVEVPGLFGSPVPVPLLFLSVPVELGSHGWPQYSRCALTSADQTRIINLLGPVVHGPPSVASCSLLYAQCECTAGFSSAWCPPSPEVLWKQLKSPLEATDSCFPACGDTWGCFT